MNNNENNNDGLNTISLGNIENSNNTNGQPISEIPPIITEPPVVETVDSLGPIDSLDDSPINNPSALEPVTPVETVQMNSEVEPVTPVNYDVPEAINDFATPVFNDIGTVPPLPDVNTPTPTNNNSGVIGGDHPKEEKPKNKKSGSKLIFVIIIVLSLAAVGVGVYIFLHISQVNAVIPKSVEIEVNSELSTNINDYATFNSVKSDTCSLDTTGITDTSKLDQDYTFKITCGEKVYTGKAKIVDKTAPVASLTEVKVAINSTIKPEDFVSKCDDATECSYEFKDKTKVDGYLKEAGSYKVDIIVKDKAGNEELVSGTLTVSNTVASLYLVCNNDSAVTKFGLEDGKFIKTAIRTYTYKMSASDYKTFKDTNGSKKEVTYENVTGTPTFDDANSTLVIEQILSYDDLKKEENTELPLDYSSLKAYYEQKKYNCNIGF